MSAQVGTAIESWQRANTRRVAIIAREHRVARGELCGGPRDWPRDAADSGGAALPRGAGRRPHAGCDRADTAPADRADGRGRGSRTRRVGRGHADHPQQSAGEQLHARHLRRRRLRRGPGYSGRCGAAAARGMGNTARSLRIRRGRMRAGRFGRADARRDAGTAGAGGHRLPVPVPGAALVAAIPRLPRSPAANRLLAVRQSAPRQPRAKWAS